MKRLNEWLGTTEFSISHGILWIMVLELRAGEWKMGALFGIMMILFASCGMRRLEAY